MNNLEKLGLDNWFNDKIDLSKTANLKIARVISAKKNIIKTLLLFMLLGIFETNAQDSLKFNPVVQSDWEFGAQLGFIYPFFVGSNKDLISNNDAGFAFGADVVYRNIFLRVSISGLNATVENSFTLSEEWPQNLPLDATQLLYSVGYKINILEQVYVKPMLSLMQLNYMTDNRVRDYTGIERSTELTYYGICLGLSYNVPSNFSILSGAELEAAISYFEPFSSTKEKNFAANVINLSIGILIFIQI